MATIVAEWMETSEEREERRLKELQRLARLKQYQRELHEANVRLCAELVDEFIVEAACLKASPARTTTQCSANNTPIPPPGVLHSLSQPSAICHRPDFVP